MKVLWVTNTLFEHHRTMMGQDASTVVGGSWLNAAYSASMCVEELQLHIVTVANIPIRKTGERDGNYFYILPGGGTRNYDVESPSNIREWRAIRNEVNPDVVIIWGTETRFAYLATLIMNGIPTAIYMQGVMQSIYNHYYEGLPFKYVCKTIRDVLDRFSFHSEYKHFSRQAVLERAMLKNVKGVIIENDWCENVCRSINPLLRFYRSNLPIRESFYNNKWSGEKVEKFSIFTNAGRYPIKGHHILLQALAIVKKKYPDFKCYIPGTTINTYDSLKRRTGYIKFLQRIIRENDLADNIIYTGPLTTEEMVSFLKRCNVYVMPSIVENHSSSLIEALIIGSPCISSLVGGTGSLVSHGDNGFLYNSLDYDALAGYIISLFENYEQVISFSKKALSIRDTRLRNFGEEMMSIYKSLIEG